MTRREGLGGFRIMWVMALFDLPTETKKQRKEATRFRNVLLDLGFTMCQYSVYMLVAPGYDQASQVIEKIVAQRPQFGLVHILRVTDKQYENMLVLQGGQRRREVNSSQLRLF